MNDDLYTTEDPGAQILTTEEVGALYDAVRSGGIEPGQGIETGAAPTPFSPPAVENGSAELKRLVGRVHGVFAVETAAALGAALRLKATLELGTAAECTPESAPLLGDELCLEVGLAGLAPFATLYLDSALVRAAADRLLGGPGLPSAPTRPLSELEKQVSRRPLEALAQALASAWRPWLSAGITTRVAIDERPRALPGPLVGAPVRLRLGEMDLGGTILYAVGPLAHATGTVPGPAAPDPQAPSLGRRLDGIPLRVSFQAPGYALSIGELLQLAPGTTLGLCAANELRVEARVEGTPRFRGRLVVAPEGSRTVAIEEPILSRGLEPPR